MLHRTAHGFSVIEHGATIAANGRRCYAFTISGQTHYNHNAGRVLQALHNGRPSRRWWAFDDNGHTAEQFDTKSAAVEWLLNRIDRGLLNETPYGKWNPEIGKWK